MGKGDCGGAARIVDNGMTLDGLVAHDAETVARAVVESGAGDAADRRVFAGGSEFERQGGRFGRERELREAAMDWPRERMRSTIS